MEPHVQILTKEEILERRARMLESTGLDLETLRERAATWQLSPEQRIAFEEYDDLTWLLGE